VEIEVLHRQGKSIREIARETRSARNRTLRATRFKRQSIRAAWCNGHEAQLHQTYIEDRIENAGKIHLSAVVLLRELRARGYDGGITQLKEYLRVIRPQLPPNPIVRFETEPGDQLQIDCVVFRRGLQPLRAFTAELGYSRYAFVAFADNERTDTLIGCLESAFAFFGGIPAHILFDNPKTIVIERDAYADGKHRYNSLLLDLAKHHGSEVGYVRRIEIRPRAKWNAFIVTCVTRSSRRYKAPNWNSLTLQPRTARFISG